MATRIDMTAIMEEVRRKLDRPRDDFQEISIGEYEQGELFICPACKYESPKHPKGSAKVYGRTFHCFSCGITRSVSNG